MGMISGGQLAVEALLEKGVTKVFSLSGGHINPLYEAAEGSALEIFTTRHEQASVFMAEAWGMLTRKPGVALVTAGPGFSNSISAIANAQMANTPLLLISGVVGLKANEKLDLQDMRQLPVIEPLVKKTLRCQKTERIAEFIDMAYRTAASGRPGPVYLELPIDVWAAQVDESSVKRFNTVTESRAVDLEKAEELLKMLGAVEKPVFIAGSGAYYSGAEKEMVEFIEKSGAPGFTSSMGRGVIPDTHALCFEAASSIRPGAASDALTGADLIVLLGNRISLYYAYGDMLNPKAKLVQVDIQPEEIGRNRTIHLGINSDIKALLAALNRMISAKGNSSALRQRFAPWVEYLKVKAKEKKSFGALVWESKAVPAHHMRICAEVNRFMGREDDLVVSDGGDTRVWMSMTRTARRSGHYLDAGLFGCLGCGLPYAHAAKLLYPEKRVCLITGDGSIGFNFMEFETAIRKKLSVVTVICNDQQWGMIRHSQEVKLGRYIKEGTEIGMVNYHKAVEALGGKGFLVEKPDDIRPALEEAFKANVPVCINVMTDPKPISPGSIGLAMIGGVDVSKFLKGA
ncbi:MAG: thiamine pyrophosphate-binding protein [Deltaproteobacteria bacterium]|nr:thiamine pyrophosphate-binding protein [Deltaproteobacteria bacterium]